MRLGFSRPYNAYFVYIDRSEAKYDNILRDFNKIQRDFLESKTPSNLMYIVSNKNFFDNAIDLTILPKSFDYEKNKGRLYNERIYSMIDRFYEANERLSMTAHHIFKDSNFTSKFIEYLKNKNASEGLLNSIIDKIQHPSLESCKSLDERFIINLEDFLKKEGFEIVEDYKFTGKSFNSCNIKYNNELLLKDSFYHKDNDLRKINCLTKAMALVNN